VFWGQFSETSEFVWLLSYFNLKMLFSNGYNVNINKEKDDVAPEIVASLCLDWWKTLVLTCNGRNLGRV